MQSLLDYLEVVDGGKMKDITCKNCGWSWDIEKGDENPYLCHNCGFDNKKNHFDFHSLEKWRKENNIHPFQEGKISENLYRRVFPKNVDNRELVWHRDKEDRIVSPIKETNWMIQMDNQLPVLLEIGKKYIIPKNTFHRVIKGDDDLIIDVIKL